MQDMCFIEIEPHLSELLERKTESETRESISRDFQSLERKVENLARVCEK